jgi:hypothetical protein
VATLDSRTSSPTPAHARRYLTPVVDNADNAEHLRAACQVAARDGGKVVALVIGLVPSSLPMGSDVPERWSRLEYEAARVRRLGRELGQEVETIMVLSDSAPAAVLQLADECRASAVCLAYASGMRAAFRRWLSPFWRALLDESPCPIVLERPRTADRQTSSPSFPVSGRPAAAER